MKRILILAPLMSILLILACTPKVTEEASQTKVEEEKPKEVDPNLSACAKFQDSDQGETALENYVIYRDFIKAKDYAQAFPLWEKAFSVAPAADGKRRTMFEDGIKLYHHKFENTESQTEKASHVNKVMSLYDKMEECYGEPGYVAGRKAFDYYYKYSAFKTNEKQAYDLFKQAIDTDGKKTKAFVINPFTASLRNLYFEDKIPMEEAKTYVNKIWESLEYGPANSDDKASWDIVKGYAPNLLESFEGTKGFYDCAYYDTKYYSLFQASPEDCEVIGKVYGYMRWGGCDTGNPNFSSVKAAYDRLCKPKVVATTTTSSGPSCRSFVVEGDYTEAAKCYEEKMNKSTDQNKKAEYALFLAKLNYGQLKNFARARKWAREAAKLRPNWGEPYILIGKLYASSGPLCGSGRGFLSQRVTWVAIDKWNYAKRIDPSVASEANKLIGQYAKYMPDVEDLFQRNLTVGQSYTVDCWINEKTKVRAKK